MRSASPEQRQWERDVSALIHTNEPAAICEAGRRLKKRFDDRTAHGWTRYLMRSGIAGRGAIGANAHDECRVVEQMLKVLVPERRYHCSPPCDLEIHEYGADEPTDDELKRIVVHPDRHDEREELPDERRSYFESQGYDIADATYRRVVLKHAGEYKVVKRRVPQGERSRGRPSPGFKALS